MVIFEGVTLLSLSSPESEPHFARRGLKEINDAVLQSSR